MYLLAVMKCCKQLQDVFYNVCQGAGTLYSGTKNNNIVIIRLYKNDDNYIGVLISSSYRNRSLNPH